MKFQLNNILLNDANDNKMRVEKIIDTSNDGLIVDLSKELNEKEAAIEIGLLKFDGDQLVVVELEDTKVGEEYIWCYIDDSLYELEEMSKEELLDGGTVTRIE